MAGLLYLPRIFVYHSEAENDSQKAIFKIMERKLYNYIMMAMLLSWLFGILLIHSLGFSVFFRTLDENKNSRGYNFDFLPFFFR